MGGLGCDNMTVIIVCLLQGGTYEELCQKCSRPSDSSSAYNGNSSPFYSWHWSRRGVICFCWRYDQFNVRTTERLRAEACFRLKLQMSWRVVRIIKQRQVFGVGLRQKRMRKGQNLQHCCVHERSCVLFVDLVAAEWIRCENGFLTLACFLVLLHFFIQF